MGYLIAVLVVLLVAGPVFWLMPSKSEKRRTELRLLARQLGLQVRLCQLPQVRRARVRREDTSPGVVYSLPLPEPGKLRPIEFCLVRENAASPWKNEDTEPLPPLLQAAVDRVVTQLPADAVALGLSAQGPAVYWQERGSDATVRALAEQLRELRDAMQAALAVNGQRPSLH